MEWIVGPIVGLVSGAAFGWYFSRLFAQRRLYQRNRGARFYFEAGQAFHATTKRDIQVTCHDGRVCVYDLRARSTLQGGKP